MEPNYSHGDYLIVDEISYRFRDPQRGEVIVFYYPEDPSYRHIKRIIGLPEETVIVENEKITIITPDSKESFLDESGYLSFTDFNLEEKLEFVLKEGEYFVLGDNRVASFDSRRWGPLQENYIIGRTVLKAFPFSSFGLSQVPKY